MNELSNYKYALLAVLGVEKKLKVYVGTHLRSDPVFAVGCLSLEHTFSPGGDVSCAVVGIALKHKLTLAGFTRL